MIAPTLSGFPGRPSVRREQMPMVTVHADHLDFWLTIGVGATIALYLAAWMLMGDFPTVRGICLGITITCATIRTCGANVTRWMKP